jgi:hypothetical protein
MSFSELGLFFVCLQFLFAVRHQKVIVPAYTHGTLENRYNVQKKGPSKFTSHKINKMTSDLLESSKSETKIFTNITWPSIRGKQTNKPRSKGWTPEWDDLLSARLPNKNEIPKLSSSAWAIFVFFWSGLTPYQKHKTVQ